jgi:hypothetical protein
VSTSAMPLALSHPTSSKIELVKIAEFCGSETNP